MGTLALIIIGGLGLYFGVMWAVPRLMAAFVGWLFRNY